MVLFIGPDGTAGSYFTTASGEALPATAAYNGRYARFQARLTSTTGIDTPGFGNVHLSFTGPGLLASSCNNFTYDPAGNITTIETVTDAGTTLDDRNPLANPINNLNQIKQRIVNGVTWTLLYDLNGNLISKTDGTNTYLYTWDADNRLRRVQGPGGLDVAYTYDSSGRMLTRTSGAQVTKYEWDGWDCVRETTGSSVTLYHIPDGTLHSFAVDGVVYQCHLDALGSVRMITDPGGAVVARIEYGAFGEETFVSTIPALVNFPYRFVGGLGVRTDSVTGLVYMRARWYDPSLARFISRDPIGLAGGPNRYIYCGNSPQNVVDPLGLKFKTFPFDTTKRRPNPYDGAEFIIERMRGSCKCEGDDELVGKEIFFQRPENLYPSHFTDDWWTSRPDELLKPRWTSPAGIMNIFPGDIPVNEM